jgi:glycosyltransferase involved in cell wall biosynthesis
MKVVLCWAGIAGYLSACWRALASRPEIDLSIIALDHAATSTSPFHADLVRGLPCRLLDEQERNDAARVAALVIEQRPDVVHIPGWFLPAFRRLPDHPALAGARFILGMDTPRRYTLAQSLNKLRLHRFVCRMDRVIVPGERSWQYARFLGAEEAKIRRGAYGIDYRGIAPAYEQRLRASGGWPRRFLSVGRYVDAKGIDVLVDGYRRYRAAVSDPWQLDCCGTGPLAGLLAGCPGVTDLGFIQPDRQAEVWAGHGAFVLASRFDPWPLVIAEATAAGLPVVCTEACGSAVELVRGCHNGLTVATGDPRALADGLRWIHDNHALCPQMGLASQHLAAAYSAELWADRWIRMIDELFQPAA